MFMETQEGIFSSPPSTSQCVSPMVPTPEQSPESK